MRVVVVGATGNVGTSLLEALAAEPQVDSVLGLARRRPRGEAAKVRWVAADITADDLVQHFRGADAVVHLAWAIQPSRDDRVLHTINVSGSERVFMAVAEAGVPVLVYASSVGAYSPGPKDRAVGEDWPTGGVTSSFYSRHKSEVERLLDRFEGETDGTRVVRLRPALIFKGEAATEIRRLFAGPFLPGFLLEPRRIPVVPRVSGLRFQAVHSRDVGDAYRLAIINEVAGAFNLAADPVLDSDELGRTLRARTVPLPASLARALTDLTWRLRLQPTGAGWLDMALQVPIMDTARARMELGWQPQHSSQAALLELLEGIAAGEGAPTPPLDPSTSGRARIEEIKTGVGSRE
jgi:UDP-glucose 4-epimerase